MELLTKAGDGEDKWVQMGGFYKKEARELNVESEGRDSG